MAYNLVRRLKEQEHPLVVVLHFQLVGVIAGLFFTLFNWQTPMNAWEWFCLLMCGLLTQVGQICLTKALQAERVAHVSILNYSGLIYALAFGVFIFGEHYTLQTHPRDRARRGRRRPQRHFRQTQAARSDRRKRVGGVMARTPASAIGCSNRGSGPPAKSFRLSRAKSGR